MYYDIKYLYIIQNNTLDVEYITTIEVNKYTTANYEEEQPIFGPKKI